MKSIYLCKHVACRSNTSLHFESALPTDAELLAMRGNPCTVNQSHLGKNGGVKILSVGRPDGTSALIVAKARTNPIFEWGANTIAHFLGVPVPNCRLINPKTDAHAALSMKLKENLHPHFSEAFLLFSPVKGFSLAELTPLQADSFTAECLFNFGQLAALDIIINNLDRLPHLDPHDEHYNAGNIMIHATSRGRVLVGIDQSTSQLDKKANEPQVIKGLISGYKTGKTAELLFKKLPLFTQKKFFKEGKEAIQRGMMAVFEQMSQGDLSQLEKTLLAGGVTKKNCEFLKSRIAIISRYLSQP